MCGPSFGSGRYGYASGSLARDGRRGIPVVGAMTPDNPGVLAAEGAAYIVPTGSSVASMRTTLPAIAGLAHRLGSGEPVGNPAEDGYLPRGLRKNVRVSEVGACRAIAALLAKLSGDVRTEVESAFDHVSPPQALGDPGSCTLALVTEAGRVPQGNPDHLPARHANTWLKYPLTGVDSLTPDRIRVSSRRVRYRAANQDPNRLVPLDAVRTLEREGRIGRLHAFFYTTSGVDTPMAVAAKFGRRSRLT